MISATDQAWLAEHGLSVIVVARPTGTVLDCAGEYEWELYAADGRRRYGLAGSRDAAEQRALAVAHEVVGRAETGSVAS